MSQIDVDELRRQMALIRREMHTDVANVVTDVGEAMDWRAPIRNHPYLAIGAGLMAGFFLAPRRKSRARRVQEAIASVPPEALADIMPRMAAVAAPAPLKAPKPAPAPAPSKSLGRQLIGWVVGMAWPLVSQSAQAYAAMWLESQLKQQLKPNLGPPPGAVPPSSSGRPGEPYDGRASRAARRG